MDFFHLSKCSCTFAAIWTFTFVLARVSHFWLNAVKFMMFRRFLCFSLSSFKNIVHLSHPRRTDIIIIKICKLTQIVGEFAFSSFSPDWILLRVAFFFLLVFLSFMSPFELGFLFLKREEKWYCSGCCYCFWWCAERDEKSNWNSRAIKVRLGAINCHRTEPNTQSADLRKSERKSVFQKGAQLN